MKKILPPNEMPGWLAEISQDSPFKINAILHESIYYPASATDGTIFEGLGGAGYSFVYVDPNIKKSILLQRIKLVAGYDVILSREILKEQLCFNKFTPVLPIPLIDENPTELRIWDEVTPYAHWVVFQRRAKTNIEHGPERFSLLFIAGEGVATYQALYYSNFARPMAIVFRNASGFAGNWTQFERQNGIFERTVMANKAGYPDYLFVDNVYDNDWSRSERSYWHNYQKIDKQYPKYNLKVYRANTVSPHDITNTFT